MKARLIKRLSLVVIPIVALALLVVVLPYFTLGLYPRTTTLYIYLGVMVFFSLLRSKEILFFKSHKNFDKVVTILIWIVSIPTFIVYGMLAIIIILVFPSTVYVVAYLLSIIIVFVFGIRLVVIGKFPKGQYIVISNHCSTVDDILNPSFMGFRSWKVVYDPTIRRIPLVKYFLRHFGIPVVRTNMESREEVKIVMDDEAKNDFSILVFPEGRRLRPDMAHEYLEKFQPGAFTLSIDNNIPILPVVVSWTYLFKPRKGQWWFSPRKIIVKILDPIFPIKNEKAIGFANRARGIMQNELKEMVQKNGN